MAALTWGTRAVQATSVPQLTPTSMATERVVGENQVLGIVMWTMVVFILCLALFKFVAWLLLGPRAIIKKREKKGKKQKIPRGPKEADAQPSSSNEIKSIVSGGCYGCHLLFKYIMGTVMRWRTLVNPLFQGVLYPTLPMGRRCSHGLVAAAWLWLAAAMVEAVVQGQPIEVVVECQWRWREEEEALDWSGKLRGLLSSSGPVKARWIGGRRWRRLTRRWRPWQVALHTGRWCERSRGCSDRIGEYEEPGVEKDEGQELLKEEPRTRKGRRRRYAKRSRRRKRRGGARMGRESEKTPRAKVPEDCHG